MRSCPITRRTALGAALAGIGGAQMTAAAAAAERSLRWIVGYPPGGATDMIARLLGQAMAGELGVPVVIENRPGAGSALGAEATARAPADGGTVMSADNGTLIYNPVLYRRLPYDPDRDFRPVGLFARLPLLLLVRQNSSLRSARDYLDAARARPATLDYASAGIGSPLHLAMERMAREMGLRLNHVPYRGTAPALNDLVAGTVESMVSDYAACAEMVRAGRAIPLMAFSAARLPALPDLPTVAELGLPGFSAYAWQGMVAPRATPDDVAARLSSALESAKSREPVRARLGELGIEIPEAGPAAFERVWRQDEAVWRPLIRELGITLDG